MPTKYFELPNLNHTLTIEVANYKCVVLKCSNGSFWKAPDNYDVCVLDAEESFPQETAVNSNTG